MNKLQKFLSQMREAAANAEAGDESGALSKAKSAYETYRGGVLAAVSAEVDRAGQAQALLYDLEGALSEQAESFGSRGRRVAQVIGDRVRGDAGSPHKLLQDRSQDDRRRGFEREQRRVSRARRRSFLEPPRALRVCSVIAVDEGGG